MLFRSSAGPSLVFRSMTNQICASFANWLTLTVLFAKQCGCKLKAEPPGLFRVLEEGLSRGRLRQSVP
jgi:hypothetical protein